jgi:NAD(P)-dependent dehydrogenase (short-subunit alcohol dehydrogenase family)
VRSAAVKRDLPEQLRFMANRRAVQKTSDASLRGRVCAVTGSTSGVGLAAARRLARAGADIVMVCRNRDKAEPIRAMLAREHGARVAIVTADFRELASVRAAAGELLGRYPRIDVLVNSAGIHSTTLTTTPSGMETVFCVNHLAPFLLTHLLLERLKASAPSRIIQVNSEGHRFCGFDPVDLDWKRRHYTGLRGYGASKTAQLLTVWEFADRLAGTGVTINAMHPGDVRTAIGSNNGPLYRAFKRVFIWPVLKDPVISGEALYWLSAAPEMAGVSGKFFHLTIEEKPADHALDRNLQRRAWDLSLSLTGLASAPRA